DNTEAFDSPLSAPDASLVAGSPSVTLGPNQQTTRTILIRNVAPAGSEELRFSAAPVLAPLDGLDGPTMGGYTWEDSRAPAGTLGRPTYVWTDITGTGT